ncbi:LamG-like jellyroll fold domain-containing protein, partial [Candidatus Entotheonella palauensis]|uniref:LamG-like jellyroll fold domain-containing protein n=1 Tax=Candidatus Entotheonella palauensis TaxID=93172 RepID=UPI00277B4C5F
MPPAHAPAIRISTGPGYLLWLPILYMALLGPCATITVANSVGDTVISFQEGIDGYTGTQDTLLNEDQPTTAFGRSTPLTVDMNIANGNEAQALIRLDSIRLFNRPLSAEEVSDVHTGGSSLGTVNIIVNTMPNDLQITATESGGLTINDDGGNDAYLRADDGDAIAGGLSQLTAEVRFSMDAFQNSSAFLSYATISNDNTLKWNIRGNGNLSFTVNGNNIESSAMDFRTLADGTPHTLSVTWDNSGTWQFFVDGAPIDSGSGLAVGQTVTGGGVLVLGNDQDTVGGGFQTDAEFAGTLYDMRIFNDVRTNSEIAGNYYSTVPNTESGLVANWTLNDLSTNGITTDTVTGNNLTVMHASGAGFVTSTPVLTLQVDENAATSSVAGTITGTDPEGDPLSYTLTGDAGGRFAIDSNSGILTVADGTLLDYETNTSHTITVRTDDGHATYDEMFKIDVKDLAEGIIVVDTTNDALDGDTDSLDTLLNNKGLDGVISLREAIAAANNTPNGTSADEIRFSILDALAGMAHTIQVGNLTDGGNGALPAITGTVNIDGTTDADFSGTPIIVLDGSDAGTGAEGLLLAAGSSGSTVRGLVINQFNGNGIEINNSHGNSIVGNYLGTDVTGTVARNNFIGIRVDNSANTIIGGLTAGTGNLISGNSVHGIYLKNAGTTGAHVYRNIIGVNANADGKLANGFDGIRMESASGTATIGNGSGDGNVIAGNAQHGISLNSANHNNIIQGNYIGTNTLGASHLGNTLNGIRIGDFVASDNLIGGLAAGEGNVIAYNDYGIVALLGTGNAIQGNSIYATTNLGIDLTDAGDPANGVTANDADDADSGVNHLQNYPVLDTAHTTGSVIAIRGSLSSTASTAYRVEWFANSAQDGSGREHSLILTLPVVVVDSV